MWPLIWSMLLLSYGPREFGYLMWFVTSFGTNTCLCSQENGETHCIPFPGIEHMKTYNSLLILVVPTAVSPCLYLCRESRPTKCIIAFLRPQGDCHKYFYDQMEWYWCLPYANLYHLLFRTTYFYCYLLSNHCMVANAVTLRFFSDFSKPINKCCTNWRSP